MYLAFSPLSDESQERAKIDMESAIKEIKSFLITNKMKLNDDKTEFLIIGTEKKLPKVTITDIMVGSSRIEPSEKARNLGVLFDEHMNLKDHINNVRKNGFFHVRNLSLIRDYLDKDVANMAAHAFITSTLDYGNSLLYGLPAEEIRKLQLVQNASARVVAKKRKYDHITEVLKELHWLQIIARIDFKILIYTWKALHDMAPEYLAELIKYKPNPRTLRSNNKKLLQDISTNLVTCGDRAFCKAAPTLWNRLPQDLRDINEFEPFKKRLKTYLFEKYY